MSDRYFVDEPISPGSVVLAGPEAHHLIHVMRAAPGLRVVLFDGSGAEFTAVVQKVGRNEVQLSVLSREEVNRELPLDLTLAVALPKGDRQKWLVEKAVELGVTRIVPLRTRARRGSAGRTGAGPAAACGRRGLEAVRPQPADANRRAAVLGPTSSGRRPGYPAACWHTRRRKKGTGPICPERPEGCLTQIGPAPPCVVPGDRAGGRVHRRRGGLRCGRRLADRRSWSPHPSRGNGRTAAGGDGRATLRHRVFGLRT